MNVVSTAIYAAAFVAICAVVIWALGRRGVFWGSAGTLGLGWLFFFVAFPGVSLGPETARVTIPGMAMLAMESSSPLPVPAFAFWSYLALIVVGILVVVSASDAMLREFLRPILQLLRGPSRTEAEPGGTLVASTSGRRLAPQTARILVLYVGFPALAGWLSFSALRPSIAAPVGARQAHPSISYDEDLVNPLRNPTPERLAEFAQERGLEGIPPDDLRARFAEIMTHEGRLLYAKNCAPCHGGKADGTGVMARALRLPPANFTDVGTIATLVEGYAFKRIQEGGIGLPAAGTPWDSAMPRWKADLTDEQIFKILLAEYDLAGVSPRVPEGLE